MLQICYTRSSVLLTYTDRRLGLEEASCYNVNSLLWGRPVAGNCGQPLGAKELNPTIAEN